jgi:16S rRNA (cytidine1402-2'-O)-methyltransferase
LLTLVPTPIGNLGDISKRSFDALLEADTILCEDTRVTNKLLTLLCDKANIEKPHKNYISIHSHNEHEFLQKTSKQFFDDAIVYVSDAGMPGISDPGQALVNYCLDNKIEYEVLPGASASLLAFVASGFVNTEFLFGAFLDHKGKSRSDKLKRLIFSGYTAIIYEAPTRLLKLLEEIMQLDPDRRIFLAKELSKKFETKLRLTAKEAFEQLKSTTIKGEWIVVVEAGKTVNQVSLCEDDIMKLKMQTKDKAKLLAQLGTKSNKEWYKLLLETE